VVADEIESLRNESVPVYKAKVSVNVNFRYKLLTRRVYKACITYIRESLRESNGEKFTFSLTGAPFQARRTYNACGPRHHQVAIAFF
jgi:hypothetical protein